MNGVATTTEVRPKTSSTSAGNAGPHAAAAIVWNRIIARSAHLMRMPERSVETGVARHDHRRDEGVHESEVGPQGLGLHVADLHRLPEPPRRIDGDSQSEDDEEEEK